MKGTLIIILSAFLFGCGKEAAKNDTVQGNQSIQSNEIKSYDENELIKTEDRNSAGKIVTTGYLLNGKKEGAWIEYFDNGFSKSVTSYHQDKKEGLFLEFNINNQVIKRCFYHNDERQGEYKEFNSMVVKEERTYDVGKLTGIVKIYYDTGTIMEEGAYENGIRNGTSKWYDQSGKLTIEYEYKNGQLVKK